MKKGFSLIEIIIVIAILGIVSTIIVSSFAAINRTQGLEKDTELVVEQLRQARSQTLSSQNATTYGVHFASTTVTVFAGSSYNPSDPTNEEFVLKNTSLVLNVSLTGGGTDIIFKRLTGETASNGTIVVSSTVASRSKTITVYKTGLIEYQ
jgi:prepilin-type N-terminal cleavage/methylation domain-containing protein